ncbi:PrsW family glutamic-type intramembrane protease [Gloeobacter kilaueensis]|uniref:FHA domain-containing protein n=1 Tax=Gloeobacter kilaueensis (strain ATCC BAA-2537 / CCAP 1431/1 / ULC 316 / JS1) TaxID=1183438 RepID=U5QHR1_GLOK1|nr:PrsW family glutamic-type intramembrane protease [Gloeobacter kilaueensis]AGY58461.1 hypothetical protein GKIL_2215 [Gloeobacter kilaueensis JS1]
MSLKNRNKGFLRQLSLEGTPSSDRHSLADAETVTLGRSPSCQIVLDSSRYSGVSRNHAQILPLPGSTGWQICDLNSANGTYINGTRLEGSHILQSGDRIMLGHNGPEFLFECEKSRLPLPEPLPVADAPPDRISITQLLPITSTGRDLLNKAYLIPGIITVMFVIAMFNSVGKPMLFNLILAFYLAGVGYYFVYQLCGKTKPWWVIVGAALSTCLILVSPLMELFFFVFRYVLPGNTDAMIGRMHQGVPVGFFEQLTTFFFGAGMLEEFVKALPVLAALIIGRRLASPWRERIGVLEPLDGILLGAACGVGFTLYETLAQYVPATVQSIGAQAGLGLGQMAGLQLLIPRIIGNVAGHMAYSGYLGYFIGLAALKRSAAKRWWIILVGYLSAASIHALWDSARVLGDSVLAFAGVIAFAFLMAAILKARKLSPTREKNFATRAIPLNK